MKFLFSLIAVLVFVFTTIIPAGAATIHVPDDYAMIQDGIDASVDGDTVLVAAGTYTGSGNKDLDFSGKAIILKSENSLDETIIDCEDEGRGFYFHNNEDVGSRLEGFTIINGNEVYGGGITCHNSSPAITNCTITGNIAVLGGGLSCWDASAPVIMNCTIVENKARYDGGALYCDDSSPTVTNCILWNNTHDEIFVYSGAPAVTFSDIQGGWTGEGNITAKPAFVDDDGGDFHLTWESPCIDSATQEGAPDHDNDGDSRPLGNGFDMGSDEFKGGLEIFLEEYPEQIEIGGTMTFTVRIENTGYEDSSFDYAEMVVTGPASVTKHLYSGDPVIILPGQDVSKSISQYVPLSSPEGVYTVMVVIYLDGVQIVDDTFDIVVGGINWRRYGFDAQNTGHNPYETVLGPDTVDKLEMQWRKSFSSSIYNSPAVVDGVVYAGTYGDYFYAFDAETGATLWSKNINGSADRGAAVSDGVVFVGSRHGTTMYALDAGTGGTIWSPSVGDVTGTAPVVEYGKVYLGCNDDKLYAFDEETGDIVWSTTAGGNVGTAAVADGVVYAGSDGSLCAFDAFTGDTLWTNAFEMSGSSPALSDGVIYTAASDGKIHAIDAVTGEELDTFATEAEKTYTPAVADGVIYAAADDGKLYAFDIQTGEVIWSVLTYEYVGSMPTVANGVVYVTRAPGPDYVSAYDAGTGELLWEYYFSAGPYGGGTPPTVVDGKVYVSATFDYALYAFHIPEG